MTFDLSVMSKVNLGPIITHITVKKCWLHLEPLKFIYKCFFSVQSLFLSSQKI